MKKMMFWFLTEFLWFFVFIVSSGIILYLHVRSDRSGSSEGDALAGLFIAGVFIIINIFFILFQWFHTILSEKNKQKYLKRKVIIFIIHSVLLFIIDIFLEFVTAFKDDNRSFDWLLGLIFFVAVSNIIYYYMVKELGKKMKWGGENE